MSAELKQYSILDKSLQVLVLATENGKVTSHAKTAALKHEKQFYKSHDEPKTILLLLLLLLLSSSSAHPLTLCVHDSKHACLLKAQFKTHTHAVIYLHTRVQCERIINISRKYLLLVMDFAPLLN